ncbi:Pol polyprotein [Elysia marginata]|uniref:Pol polyprotein n=1 Tax=Elysia marginata TaxID=1093978 RepID=A0AAV4FMW6_9GAST|nr:Pol polyprotein [Elysia marginata]
MFLKTGAFLGTISSHTESPWKARVFVNGKDMAFKIDTGADVTVIPEALILTGVIFTPTSRKFYGPGNMEVGVLGKFPATLQLNSGNRANQDIYVLKGQKEALVARPAIQALDMIKRINLITEPEDAGKEKSTKNKDIGPHIQEKYPELFSGLGKLDREYTIEIKDDATPSSVFTPRRISIPLQKKVEEELK